MSYMEIIEFASCQLIRYIYPHHHPMKDEGVDF